MIVLGIDPGTETSHAVLYASGDPIDGPRGVRRCWSMPNAELLGNLRDEKYGITAETVAIESMDARGMRLGQDTLDAILWIGRFQEASGGVLVPRSMVKDVLCGHRKADDAAIRLRLIDLLGKPGTKKQPGATYGVVSHLWQALAVAYVYCEQAKKGQA